MLRYGLGLSVELGLKVLSGSSVEFSLRAACLDHMDSPALSLVVLSSFSAIWGQCGN